jgi:hypothetical protein
MKPQISFYLTIVFLLSPILADAQILNRIRRAAEQGVSNAVERRVEKEMENATQRQLEKAFGELYGSEANIEGTGLDLSKLMKGVNLNVPTEDAYRFSGKAVMEMNGTDEKGKAIDPVLMITYLSEIADYSGMEFSTVDQKQQKDGMEKTIMIFDMKNKASVILVENEGERTSMALGFDADIEERILDNDTLNLDDIKFEKTGNTKTIAGHLCEEYKAENEEGMASYWVSREPVKEFTSFWGKNSPFLTKRVKSANKEYFDKLPDGDVLEINSKSKTDKSTWIMTTKSLDTSSNTTFVMADYPNMMAGTTAGK